MIVFLWFHETCLWKTLFFSTCSCGDNINKERCVTMLLSTFSGSTYTIVDKWPVIYKSKNIHAIFIIRTCVKS